MTCRPWQALQVTGAAGQHYVIRNKPSTNHNDLGMRLSDPGRRAAFTVTRSPGRAPSSKVRASPYIGTGCFEGACPASGEGELEQAGSPGNYTVGWTTVTPRDSGAWNASLDLWLGPPRRSRCIGGNDLAQVQQAVVVGEAVSDREDRRREMVHSAARHCSWPLLHLVSAGHSSGSGKAAASAVHGGSRATRRAARVLAAVVRPGWLRNLVRREGPGDQQVLNHPVNPGHGNPTSGETLDQPRTGIIGPLRLRADRKSTRLNS